MSTRSHTGTGESTDVGDELRPRGGPILPPTGAEEASVVVEGAARMPGNRGLLFVELQVDSRSGQVLACEFDPPRKLLGALVSELLVGRHIVDEMDLAIDGLQQRYSGHLFGPVRAAVVNASRAFQQLRHLREQSQLSTKEG